jgi:carbonic anhydrase
VAVHGWIYGIHDGLLQDLNIVVTGANEIAPAYHAAISRITE